jgi:ATP-dependent protease ClpP protease subunit
VCIGTCASMAAIIFEYGHERHITDRSVLMFHEAAGGVQGTLNQMNSRLSMIRRYVGKLDLYVANRMGIDLNTYHLKESKELWIDGEDAVNTGAADKLVAIKYEPKPGIFMAPLEATPNKRENELELKWNL